MDYNQLLAIISKRYSKILDRNLVSIYIHGSIAFQCFNWEKSDIDFIVVVNDVLSQQAKLDLLQVLEELRCQGPQKGFEMSVVIKSYCKDFKYPTPYELHFSNGWLERYLQNPLLLCNNDVKSDYDLAAHFTVITNVSRGRGYRQHLKRNKARIQHIHRQIERLTGMNREISQSIA